MAAKRTAVEELLATPPRRVRAAAPAASDEENAEMVTPISPIEDHFVQCDNCSQWQAISLETRERFAAPRMIFNCADVDKECSFEAS